MFAILKAQPGPGLSHADVSPPGELGPNDVQIAVKAAGICGTDFHIWKWDEWSARRVKAPRIVGHEFVGRVERVGSAVRNIGIGQRVSAECHVTCGHCRACRTGQGHVCANTSIIGVDRNGCFAERLVVPESNVWIVDDAIPDHHAAVFDPCGNAMHTATIVPLAGRDVLITGAGTIGLFATAIARAHGARKVIVTEPGPYRAHLAKEVGADLVIDPLTEDAKDRILKETHGDGVDVVLEMSGFPDALRMALTVTTSGGHVVLLGLPAKEVTLDLSEQVIMRGLTLHGVTGRRIFGTWYDVSAFMLRSPDLMDRIVTHQMPAPEYSGAFQTMAAGQCGKIVLDFEALRA